MGCGCKRDTESEIEIIEKVKITHRRPSSYKWIIVFLILVLIIIGLYMFINRNNDIELILAPAGHIRGRIAPYEVELPNLHP
jgi:hypothetical protein